MLSCAQSHAGRFSLKDSRILVKVSPAGCTITFHDECTGCGLCAESCLYGALVKVRREDGT
jgi:ferredoxin